MNFNAGPLKQVYIPINKPGGFDNLKSAQVHRKVVGKAQELREAAQETINDLRAEDKTDIGSVPSDPWTDLANDAGHVIMVGEDENGGTRGVELKFNPDSGRVNSFVADTPEGKLSQGIDSSEDGISPTYKWEENVNGQNQTTYFKFDDNAGVLAILDPNNQQPSILEGVEPSQVEGGFITNPLKIFPY